MHALLAAATTSFEQPGHAVSIAAGPLIADMTQTIELAVARAATSVRITLPAYVGWTGGARGDFGSPALIETGNGPRITTIEWTRSTRRRRTGTARDRIALRLRVPAVPFTELRFEIRLESVGAPASASTIYLPVVPAHAPGWNRFVLPRALTHEELDRYFGDAQMVWRGASAYSSDAATTQLIAMTPGVTVLTSGLERDDGIWVLYAPSRGGRCDT